MCEIEPVIPPTSTRYFGQQDYDVLYNPRTRIVFDDARHYVLTTPQKFDIVASDPLDVFVKGTAALYTKEYFDAIKQRLNPGGFFSLYVPLYESDERTVRSEVATFFASFPYGTVWANTVDGRGYDMVLLGQAGPLEIDLDAVEARLERPDYRPVVASLGGVGVYSAADLFGTYAGQKSDLGRWTAGARVEPRPRSSPPIPRWLGHQFHTRRCHLPAHAELPPAAGGNLQRLAATRQRGAGRHQ